MLRVSVIRNMKDKETIFRKIKEIKEILVQYRKLKF